jgi:hypothetical protein
VAERLSNDRSSKDDPEAANRIQSRQESAQKVYERTLDIGRLWCKDAHPTINSCGKETASPVISVAGEVFLCDAARTNDSDKLSEVIGMVCRDDSFLKAAIRREKQRHAFHSDKQKLSEVIGSFFVSCFQD